MKDWLRDNLKVINAMFWEQFRLFETVILVMIATALALVSCVVEKEPRVK